MNLSSRISPDVVRFLRNELGSTIGCLQPEAARPEDAVRRVHRDEDGDGIFIGQPGADPYLIDAVLKLLSSRGLRREARHTHVVPGPVNLHIRTRRSHTDEVVGLATMLAALLGVNQSLCLAGALGHDIGHTPFGHFGEMFLTEKTGRSFRHEIFGCVMVQRVERSGRGLNLTKQTLQVMLKHSRGAGELTTDKLSPEEAIVMFADKTAYLFADYNDFIRLERGGCWVGLDEEDKEAIHTAMHRLGDSQRERVARCLVALCRESAEVGAVSFSRGSTFELFDAAKRHMYRFYPSNDPSGHGFDIYRAVYNNMAEVLPGVDTTTLFSLLCDDDLARLVGHVSMRPTRAITELLLTELSTSDVIPTLQDASIDPFDPDLDWEGIPDASYSA